MAYPPSAFSSANPAVDSLFSREFAGYQGSQQAQSEKVRNAIMREQIAAQAKLADAQLRGQQQEREQSNLFRMNQSKQVDRQLDIDEKYKGALSAKTGARSTQEIDEANAMSESIASQLNGSYQTKFTVADAALDKKYADDVKALGTWNLGLPGNTAASAEKLKTDYEAAKAILPDTIFNQLHDIGTKYYPAGAYGADPVARKFLPVRVRGGTAAPAGAPPAGAASVGQGLFDAVKPTRSVVPTTQASPVPFNVGEDVIPSYGGPGTTSFVPRPNLMGEPTAIAPVAQPSTPAIRIAVPGGSLEMPPAVAEEVARQVSAIPPEQRAAAKDAILDGLLKSGRARIIEAPRTFFQKEYPVGYPVGY